MDAAISKHLPRIKQILQQYGVQHAYLFGSAAAETMKQNSDVDVLIRFRPGLDFVTYTDNYFNIIHALQRLLHKEVELLAEETITNPYLRQSIEQTKVQLL